MTPPVILIHCLGKQNLSVNIPSLHPSSYMEVLGISVEEVQTQNFYSGPTGSPKSLGFIVNGHNVVASLQIGWNPTAGRAL